MKITIRLFLSVVVLLVCACLYIACSTSTGDAAKDARGRAVNQVGSEVVRTLGSAATSLLLGMAEKEMSGGKFDFGSAASDGLWRSAGSIVSSGAVARIINAYSGNNLPKTAEVAAQIVQDKGASPNVTNAIAAVISTAAGAPPAK